MCVSYFFGLVIQLKGSLTYFFHSSENDGEKTIKTVYIDNPCPPIIITKREKNQMFHEVALKSLIQQPLHGGSEMIGSPHKSDVKNNSDESETDVFGGSELMDKLETFGALYPDRDKPVEYNFAGTLYYYFYILLLFALSL